MLLERNCSQELSESIAAVECCLGCRDDWMPRIVGRRFGDIMDCYANASLNISLHINYQARARFSYSSGVVNEMLKRIPLQTMSYTLDCTEKGLPSQSSMHTPMKEETKHSEYHCQIEQNISEFGFQMWLEAEVPSMQAHFMSQQIIILPLTFLKQTWKTFKQLEKEFVTRLRDLDG